MVQFEEIKQATIHQEMQPAFAENLGAAIDQGVQVLAYNCHVTPATIELKSQVTLIYYRHLMIPINNLKNS